MKRNHKIQVIKTSTAQSNAQSSTRPSKGPIRPATSMPVINPHAAGVDIGSREHYVCVPSDSVSQGKPVVRRFGVFTADLDSLVEWLRQCGVQTVAMESTGEYWKPLYWKLAQASIEPILVNARHLHQVPGRKTDMKDCQWIQQLHSYGLLNGSFQPDTPFCQLRTLLRHRANLVIQKGQQVQLMQKALQQMNILVHNVVSDLDGDTGLRIVDAMLSGERDPRALVKLRDYRIKRSTVAEMEAALQGNWQSEQVLMLKQGRQAYQFFEGQIKECDQSIQSVLQALPTATKALPEPMEPEGSKPLPKPDAAGSKKNANANPEVMIPRWI